MHDLVWETADGRFIPVSAMSTRHINNCIRKIDRSRKGWRKEYRERLILELELRSQGLHDDPGDHYA